MSRIVDGRKVTGSPSYHSHICTSEEKEEAKENQGQPMAVLVVLGTNLSTTKSKASRPLISKDDGAEPHFALEKENAQNSPSQMQSLAGKRTIVIHELITDRRPVWASVDLPTPARPVCIVGGRVTIGIIAADDAARA